MRWFTVLLLVLVAGCSGQSATSDLPVPVPTVATPAVAVESRPTQLRIPSIGVDAQVIDLGLTPEGELEVPADGQQVGWYVDSPTPGEVGPSVLAGHVDWNGPGVFQDLVDMDAGDEILVDREDGSTMVFAVTAVQRYPKNEFPTGSVYGDVGDPQLRLITCGGDFDRAVGHYRDNVVVYAKIV